MMDFVGLTNSTALYSHIAKPPPGSASAFITGRA